MWLPTTEGDATDDDRWVEPTASLPLAFAQVREDATIDLGLLQRLNRPARVAMVASGGETAALLSTMPLQRLHLVDMNPAQLAITRLKLRLLADCDPAQRQRLLGHAPMPASERSAELLRHLQTLNLPPDALGPIDWVGRFGPDHCGRYEWLFARFRQLLADREGEIRQLMLLRQPHRQSQLVAGGTDLGDRIESAWEQTMELSRLVKIFGPDATANRIQPFAQHFIDQTRWVLGKMPAADNPFLHQIFLGEFIGPLWPWLTEPSPASLPETVCTLSRMNDLLAGEDDQSYDLIHLSNILDWISPSEALAVLRSAFRCLSPGGLVVIRQLNSQLDITAFPAGFRWDRELAHHLHESDRSFFYRSLNIGWKP